MHHLQDLEEIVTEPCSVKVGTLQQLACPAYSAYQDNHLDQLFPTLQRDASPHSDGSEDCTLWELLNTRSQTQSLATSEESRDITSEESRDITSEESRDITSEEMAVADPSEDSYKPYGYDTVDRRKLVNVFEIDDDRVYECNNHKDRSRKLWKSSSRVVSSVNAFKSRVKKHYTSSNAGKYLELSDKLLKPPRQLSQKQFYVIL